MESTHNWRTRLRKQHHTLQRAAPKPLTHKFANPLDKTSQTLKTASAKKQLEMPLPLTPITHQLKKA